MTGGLQTFGPHQDLGLSPRAQNNERPLSLTLGEALDLKRYLLDRDQVRSRIQDFQDQATHLEGDGRCIEASELRKRSRILAVLWELEDL